MTKVVHRCFRCKKLENEKYLHTPVRYKGKVYWEHRGVCEVPVDSMGRTKDQLDQLHKQRLLALTKAGDTL
jgi:hypothetical protein